MRVPRRMLEILFVLACVAALLSAVLVVAGGEAPESDASPHAYPPPADQGCDAYPGYPGYPGNPDDTGECEMYLPYVQRSSSAILVGS